MRQQSGDWMALCSRMDWETDLVEPVHVKAERDRNCERSG
jgi:hypothetical protein